MSVSFGLKNDVDVERLALRIDENLKCVVFVE